MNEVNRSKWIISIFTAYLVSACGSHNASSIPEISVNEVIAQTAAAAQTQTVTNMPSVTPTRTLTVTPTPSVPSSTPTATQLFGIFVEAPLVSEVETPDVLIAGAASDANPNGPKIKYTDDPWSCEIISRSPPKGATLQPGDNFYVSWTVANNGTKTWTRNGVDFVYDSGFRHEGGPIKDMSKTILRGGTITLQVLIVSPKKEETYNVIWALQVGKTRFCHLEVTFKVKK